MAFELLKLSARLMGKKLLKAANARRLDKMYEQAIGKHLKDTQVVRNSGRRFLDFGRIGTLFLLLVGGSFSHALGGSHFHHAFDEYLFSDGESRQAIERSANSVEEICRKLISPSNADLMACRWPAQVKSVLKAYDALNRKSNVPSVLRSSRLTSPVLSRHDLINNGMEIRSADLVATLEALELSGQLTDMTHALIARSQSVSWRLTQIQKEVESLEQTRAMAIIFVAWAQSEDPLGFLLGLRDFEVSSSEEVSGVFACLREEEGLAYAVDNADGLQVQRRLIFKEVEVARSAANLPSPGLLNEGQLKPDELQNAIESVLKASPQTNSHEIAREMNGCRALAEALEAVGISEAEINRQRLRCETARERGEALSAKGLPTGTATRQFALIVNEARAERGYRPAALERRAASLFLNLKSAPKSGVCKVEIKSRLAGIISTLRQLITNKEFQE